MSQCWLARAGKGGFLIDEFDKAGYIAVSWPKLSDMSGLNDETQLYERAMKACPERFGKNGVHRKVLKILCLQMREGDMVVCSAAQRKRYVLVGKVAGPYEYKESRFLHPKNREPFSHSRPVHWMRRVDRSALSLQAHKKLDQQNGAIFPLDSDTSGEINKHLDNALGTFPIPPDDDDNPPRRVKYTAARTVRNTQKGLDLKSLYNSCQVCGHAIRVPGHIPRVYLEVHHLRPLGGDHKGKDNWNNMLVLCPNCHASFDSRAMAIHPESRYVYSYQENHRSKPTFNAHHKLDPANIEYHWKRCSPWLESV